MRITEVNSVNTIKKISNTPFKAGFNYKEINDSLDFSNYRARKKEAYSIAKEEIEIAKGIQQDSKQIQRTAKKIKKDITKIYDDLMIDVYHISKYGFTSKQRENTEYKFSKDVFDNEILSSIIQKDDRVERIAMVYNGAITCIQEIYEEGFVDIYHFDKYGCLYKYTKNATEDGLEFEEEYYCDLKSYVDDSIYDAKQEEHIFNEMLFKNNKLQTYTHNAQRKIQFLTFGEETFDSKYTFENGKISSIESYYQDGYENEELIKETILYKKSKPVNLKREATDDRLIKTMESFIFQ